MPERISTRSSAVPNALACRRPFTTHGNLRAAKGGSTQTGRLPEPYRTAYRHASQRGDIAYTVYSYRTPIAWLHADGSLIVPAVTYSPTTSRHQHLLRALEESVGNPVRAAGNRERVHGPVALSSGDPAVATPSARAA